MPIIECTYGPVTTEVMGTSYTFSPDEYGRCVAEVWDRKHIDALTSVEHYQLVQKEPVPLVLTSLTPTEAVIGGADITLVATGEGFLKGSQIVFNEGVENTVYVSDTHLQTTVRPSTATTAGSYPVLVRNRNGEESSALDFTFTETEALSEADPAPAAALEAEDDPGDQPVTAISGIGAATAAKLEAAGVTTVRQIAELDEEEAAELDARVGLNGRIARDGWVESAKALIA